eukprot:CAMPEP_0182496358 /NCGR_PEP_ID=MMETSP1321-20130603/5016_1 /TAXON_ID=91990 /ORGANISM="Bolidomonas sp., Strain RCC1657" /LENGTH=919 /DNA_ID=CAMNT_0024699959 /DNA_START=167 /DNA_END=2923 /DNA_ORIENTATION=+
MTKILLVFLVLLSVCSRGSAESFTLITRDSYGDDWNGGVLTITNAETDGVAVSSTGPQNGCIYAPPGNTCERTETINLECGTFSAQQSGSEYNGEVSWVIKGADGETVAEASSTSSATFSTCGITAAPTPTPPVTPVGEMPPRLAVSGMCSESQIADGLYSPIAKTNSGRWYYRSENDYFLYWDPNCSGGNGWFNSEANTWRFASSEPSTTADDNLDGLGDCADNGHISSIDMSPPTGTKSWTVLCPSPQDIPISIVPVVDHNIATAQELYHKISEGGNSIMNSGGQALLNAGEYKCSPCELDHTMFKTNALSGGLICKSEDLSCVLDGEDTRRVLWVYGTGSSVLKLKGLRFFRGKDLNSYGGGLLVHNGASVNVEFCSFESCHAGMGGGISVYGSSSLIVHATIFEGNTAGSTGDDINNSGVAAFYDTCPTGWVGKPEKGSSLDSSGIQLFGIANSFSIGSCSVCPLGKEGASSWYDLSSASTCQTCVLGKFRSENEASCTVCSAGKYNNDAGTAASLHETCQNCPAGTHLSDEATNVDLHDSDTDCSTCEAGQYSPEAAEVCTDCAPGKYIADDGNENERHAAVTDCTDCEAGKYNEEEGARSCSLCREGKYLDTTGATSETQCKLCPEGKYNDDDGLTTDCYDCDLGKFAPSTGYRDCDDCVTGTYAADEGSSDCDQCEEGKHANVTGSKACFDCELGTFAENKGAVVCTLCVGGKYSDRGATVCNECVNGTYSNPGAATCDTCNHTEGFISHARNGDGNNACEYCGIGKYADLPTHKCKPCQHGTYSVGGVNQCLECEPGKFNLNDGASSCSPCEPGSVPDGTTGCTICTAGKYAAFGTTECTDCNGAGQYSNQDGSAACLTAPAGMKPTDNRDNVESCLPGTYSVGGADACSNCGSGETSEEGAAGCSKCTTC